MMANNTIILGENATVVIAFGNQKDYPPVIKALYEQSQQNNANKPEKTSNTTTTGTTDDAMRAMLYQCIIDRGYSVCDDFISYEYGDYYMVEDVDQWFYIRQVGGRMIVIGYETYDSNTDEYKTVYDFRDLEFSTHVRSSFDDHFCGKPLTNKCIGGDNIPYVCGFIDYITGEKYYVLRETVEKFMDSGRMLSTHEQPQYIAGKKVRPMTFEEEQAWNEDRLFALVDVWGNISDYEEPNERWINARI